MFKKPTDTSRPWYKRKSPDINTKRKKSSTKLTARTSTQWGSRSQWSSPQTLRKHFIQPRWVYNQQTCPREIHTTKSRQHVYSAKATTSHCLRKAAKKIPSSNGPRHLRERSTQGHPSGSADSMPQGPAPRVPSSQTGGPPWAPPVNNQNNDHQDPPECNGTTNGSTRAPADGKGPGAAKAANKASEPCPGTSPGTGPATQPADSSKNTIVCSACGDSGHWSRNCPYYNFCDFCRVTTHSTHLCRATKYGPGSPVSIYCGKTNYSSAYCRYRPRDNQEEPRNTPDALKSGNTGKNLGLVARNQTGSHPSQY